MNETGSKNSRRWRLRETAENKLSLSECGLMDFYGDPEAQMSSLAHNNPPASLCSFSMMEYYPDVLHIHLELYNISPKTKTMKVLTLKFGPFSINPLLLPCLPAGCPHSCWDRGVFQRRIPPLTPHDATKMPHSVINAEKAPLEHGLLMLAYKAQPVAGFEL